MKNKDQKEVSRGYISSVHTINSMYAQGKVCIVDKFGAEYRMDVSQILKLIQEKDGLLIATKKAKYYHLTLA